MIFPSVAPIINCPENRTCEKSNRVHFISEAIRLSVLLNLVKEQVSGLS